MLFHAERPADKKRPEMLVIVLCEHQVSPVHFVRIPQHEFLNERRQEYRVVGGQGAQPPARPEPGEIDRAVVSELDHELTAEQPSAQYEEQVYTRSSQLQRREHWRRAERQRHVGGPH
ncbi:hypothetical protein D3C83_23150 [compost metagenome]